MSCYAIVIEDADGTVIVNGPYNIEAPQEMAYSMLDAACHELALEYEGERIEDEVTRVHEDGQAPHYQVRADCDPDDIYVIEMGQPLDLTELTAQRVYGGDA